MRKKKNYVLSGFICLLFAAAMLAGCQKQSADYTDLAQLNNSNISVAMWSCAPMDNVMATYLPKAKPVIAVDSITLIMESLKGEKVDAVLASKVFYDSFPNKDGLRVLTSDLGSGEYGFLFAKNQTGEKLQGEMNEFIVKANQSGLREELEKLWLGETVIGREIGKGCDDPNAPEVVFAVEYETPPFGYVENDTCVGFDVDYAECFCREYGYRLKVVGLPFSMIAAGDTTGEYDFAGGALMLDEEIRSDKITSDLHYLSPFAMVVRDSGNATERVFSLKDSLERTFLLDSRWKMYLDGLLNTLLITAVAATAGTLLGFLVYLVDINAGKGFHSFVKLIFTVLHITPTVVLLLIFYHIVFRGVNISGLVVSMILFTLLMTGSVFNLMTTSVNTIDHGQKEAAIALGCTPSQAFYKVVMPQALRYFIPIYKGELVGLIISTSIVGYIAVQDLTKVSDIIRTRTFDAFVPLFSAAVIYILLALLMIWLVNLLLKKTDPKNRSREKILAGLDDGKEVQA